MVSTKYRRILKGILLLGLVLLVGIGCTTRNEAFVEVDNAVNEGRYLDAAQSMSGEDRSDFYKDRDKVLYFLDVGMLYHYGGEFDQSIQYLNEAELLIEEYFTKSVTQAAGSLLLNDTVMDYAGEDYEDLYLNVFKALNFLKMGDLDGGFVEVRRVNTKLNLLEDKYASLAASYSASDDSAVDLEAGSSRFYNSALARYLSLLLYRAEGDWDGARIDYNKFLQAYELQPEIYDFAPPIEETAIEPAESPRLSVLAFSGRSPVKKANTLYVVTGPNQVTIVTNEEDDEGVLIPTNYSSFYWPGIESGFRFKFQLPYMDLQGTQVSRVRLLVDGQPSGELGMIENMERIAEETFQVKYPIIFMKTVTRTIVKGLVAQQAKKQAESQGLAAGLLGAIVADVAVEASEQADLRTSRYFPSYAFAGEFELPAGEHRIEIEYLAGETLLFRDDLGTRTIAAGGLNLATSYVNR